ncbi:MAG: homing endonuclease associated repeat-containing protein [Sarcina sp.]
MKREEIVKAIKKFKEEEGRNPNVKDFQVGRLEYMPSIASIYREFTGIDEALLYAGLDKNYKGRKLEEVLVSLDKFIKKYDRLPTKKDLLGPNRNKEYPEYRAFGKFGGIRAVFLLLEYEEEDRKLLLNEISDEEFREKIRLTALNHLEVYETYLEVKNGMNLNINLQESV